VVNAIDVLNFSRTDFQTLNLSNVEEGLWALAMADLESRTPIHPTFTASLQNVGVPSVQHIPASSVWSPSSPAPTIPWALSTSYVTSSSEAFDPAVSNNTGNHEDTVTLSSKFELHHCLSHTILRVTFPLRVGILE
jgi:hypothetical protein